MIISKARIYPMSPLIYFFLFIYIWGLLLLPSRDMNLCSYHQWSISSTMIRGEPKWDKLIIASFRTYLLRGNACAISRKEVWKGKWGHPPKKHHKTLNCEWCFILHFPHIFFLYFGCQHVANSWKTWFLLTPSHFWVETFLKPGEDPMSLPKLGKEKPEKSEDVLSLSSYCV